MPWRDVPAFVRAHNANIERDDSARRPSADSCSDTQRRSARRDVGGEFPSQRGKVLGDLTALLRRVKGESDTPGRIATVHGFRSSAITH
jgi:hypothetical protein